MAALWQEFGQDLVQSPNGGLLMAYGEDEVRQALERELLTTPALTLDDGTVVPAEFIWDPTFGVGLRVLIGQTAYEGWLSAIKQKINNAVLSNPGVNSSIPPVIQVTQTGQLVTILVDYTLANGTPGSLALQIAGV